ncbi:MAG: hypothetical protein GWP70_10145 [Proteobacteria bacterium]|nr:hypothetical protein [Pseudomonadota bacterium]
MHKFLYNALFSHPADVNEGYLEHLLAAVGFATRLLLAAGACFVHALLPCLFQRTASSMLHRLHGQMHTNRAAKLDLANADKEPCAGGGH